MTHRHALLASLALLAAISPAVACVVEDGRLRPHTRAESDLLMMQSGQNYPFYINRDVLVLGGYTFAQYGLPRKIDPADLTMAASYDGVPFFKAAGETDTLPDIFYFLADAEACSFQPYQIGELVK